MAIDLSQYTDEQKKELLISATQKLAEKTKGSGVLGNATAELASRASSGTLNVSQEDDLTKKINSNQQNDFSIKQTSEEPETRSKLEEQINVEEPTAPELEKKYEKYTTGKLGSQYKTTDLEEELSSLDEQIAAENAISAKRYSDIEGETVPLGVIGGRLTEAEKQQNTRLSALTTRATLIQDQLKTRYSLIQNMMSYSEKDYSIAKEEYDTAYERSYNAIQDTNELASEEKKDALTTWQTVSNLITDGSISYKNLTESQKLSIIQTETKAGLPAGTLELITKSTDGGKIVSTSTADLEDGKYAYVVIQGLDGSVSTKKMYLGKTSKTGIESVEDSPDKQAIIADIEAITGKKEGEKYVDTAKIQQIRHQVALYSPELLDWFDNAYKPASVLNPNDKTAQLLITTNQW